MSVAHACPLTLPLLGIVFGRSLHLPRLPMTHAATQRAAVRGLVFSIASVVAPLLLGMRGRGSDQRHHASRHGGDGFASWLSPFAWAVGVLAVDPLRVPGSVPHAREARRSLREDFRRQA